MTKEQQDKLRRALYNAKFTTDAEDENPFVGIFFNDLLDIIHDFGQQHPNWIPVEEYPKVDISCTLLVHYVDGTIDICDYYGDFYDYTGENVTRNVTHWMPIVPPRKEE